MGYDNELKSGQKVYFENANGDLFKATVINVNYYREPSMTVALQVDGISDVIFMGLEKIKILEEELHDE